MAKDIKNPETIALHGGEYRNDPATTAVAVPIYRSTSYQFNNAEHAANQLLISLKIDSEPLVRSNCIWALGRLYESLELVLRDQVEEALLNVLLNDPEPSVRYEARTVLEQIDNPPLEQRLKRLIDQGLLA